MTVKSASACAVRKTRGPRRLTPSSLQIQSRSQFHNQFAKDYWQTRGHSRTKLRSKVPSQGDAFYAPTYNSAWQTIKGSNRSTAATLCFFCFWVHVCARGTGTGMRARMIIFFITLPCPFCNYTVDFLRPSAGQDGSALFGSGLSGHSCPTMRRLCTRRVAALREVACSECRSLVTHCRSCTSSQFVYGAAVVSSPAVFSVDRTPAPSTRS